LAEVGLEARPKGARRLKPVLEVTLFRERHE
jgi:hypothetical protein